MADNITANPGTGGDTIAADDIAGVKHQRVKISQGADGSATDVSSAAPLQVTLANTGANTNKILTTVDQATAANLNAQVVGNVAAAATDSGNPVKVGGVFNSTMPTYTNGQRGDLQTNAKGGLRIELTDSSANTAALVNASADGVSLTNSRGISAQAIHYIYNGTTLDKAKSIVNGNDSDGTGIQAAGMLAQFDDTTPGTVTENKFGNIRMSVRRELYGQIRDAAGNERGG